MHFFPYQVSLQNMCPFLHSLTKIGRLILFRNSSRFWISEPQLSISIGFSLMKHLCNSNDIDLIADALSELRWFQMLLCLIPVVFAVTQVDFIKSFRPIPLPQSLDPQFQFSLEDWIQKLLESYRPDELWEIDLEQARGGDGNMTC